MKSIAAKDVHIAVLNKAFKTNHYQSDGLISWEENEVVQVTKHTESNLWYCLKLNELVAGTSIYDLHNRLVVSRSHLNFVDINWETIKK